MIAAMYLDSMNLDGAKLAQHSIDGATATKPQRI